MTEHVAHELTAMEAAFQLHHPTGLWIALEDFLLHARLLREFFWTSWDPEGPYAESAVLAEHFIPSWRATSGGAPQCFRDAKDAVDQQLAHIARERVTSPQDLRAVVVPMHTELWSVWRRFLQAMDTDPRAALLRTALANRAQALGVTPPADAI